MQHCISLAKLAIGVPHATVTFLIGHGFLILPFSSFLCVLYRGLGFEFIIIIYVFMVYYIIVQTMLGTPCI